QRSVIFRPPALGLLRRAGELLDRASVVSGAEPVARHRADRLRRRPSRALEELCDERMLPRSLRPRQELVSDVTDRGVGERELLLVLENRHGLAPYEVAALELGEDPVNVTIGAQRSERVRPEHLSD